MNCLGRMLLGGCGLHPGFLPNFRDIADRAWQGGVGVRGAVAEATFPVGPRREMCDLPQGC